MKNNIIKCMVALFSILFLVAGNTAFADEKEKAVTPEVQSQTTQEVQPAVDAKTDDNVAEQRKKIFSEANIAIAESKKALKALDEGNTEDALRALELATGNPPILNLCCMGEK